MAASRKPTQRNVTELFDTRLPVSLRLRGFGSVKIVESAPSPLRVMSKHDHPTSLHILALRSEAVVTAPAPSAPLTLPQPAENFDAFAKEFFAHLSIEEDLPAKDTQQEAKEVAPENALLHQIEENDAVRPTRTRLNTFKLPRIHLSLPSLKLPRLPKTTGVHRLGLHHRFLIPSPSFRGIAVFVLLSFIFVLPLQAMQSRPQALRIKGDLLSGSSEALALMEDGARLATETQFVEATDRFAAAGNELNKARTTLDSLGLGTKLIASLVPQEGGTLKTGKALLDLGYELSISAERIGDGLSAIGNLADTSLGTKIEILEQYLASALPHLSAATLALSRINPETIPREHVDRFEELSTLLPVMEERLNRLQSFSEVLKTVLGNEEKKRYLFVFQNNTEIRPTGGFIGSFAEVDLYRGEVEQIYLPGDGSYNLQGAQRLLVEAPKPLTLINPRWEFQDANWFPDFKASSQKLLEFHAAAGGPTVDGVIAVNASFVSELLKVIGPIEMPAYGRTITADNFILETQTLVEDEYDREENKPKQFLADLAPEIMTRIKETDASAFLPLLETLSQGLGHKDIQMFFTDRETQETVREFGWSGELASTSGDYLMVVNANLGGGKTDAVIEETVDVNSTILEDGRIQNTVSITRMHHGIAGAPFTGVNNVNYVQLLVPRGSHLLKVEGSRPPASELFEVDPAGLQEDKDLAFLQASAFTGPDGADVMELHGKAVFGSWTQTKPGQTSTITFTYELPFSAEWTDTEDGFLKRAEAWLGMKSTAAHTLTIDPQSGSLGRTTHVTISFPSDRKPLWTTDLIDANAITTMLSGAESGFLGILFE